MASLGTDFEANFAGSRPDTVFFAAERWVGVGIVGEWDTVDLDTPFYYNGTDNLLVEVTWNGTGCGDEDAVMQYGPSLDGTNRRAWEFDWQATTAQRADVNEFNVLLGFEDAGVEEPGTKQEAGRRTPTVACGVLRLPGSGVRRGASSVLLNVSGRKVLDLEPGENDVSHLAPGVYFLHSTLCNRRSPLVSKVVIQ